MTNQQKACFALIKHIGQKTGKRPLTTEQFMAFAYKKNRTVVDSIIRTCRQLRPGADYAEISHIAVQSIYEIAGLDFQQYEVGA